MVMIKEVEEMTDVERMKNKTRKKTKTEKGGGEEIKCVACV